MMVGMSYKEDDKERKLIIMHQRSGMIDTQW